MNKKETIGQIKRLLRDIKKAKKETKQEGQINEEMKKDEEAIQKALDIIELMDKSKKEAEEELKTTGKITAEQVLNNKYPEKFDQDWAENANWEASIVIKAQEMDRILNREW